MAMNLMMMSGTLVLTMTRSRRRRRRTTTRKVKAASFCQGWHHHPPPGVRYGQGGREVGRDHGISQTPRLGQTPWKTRNVLNTLALLVSWPDTTSKGSSNEKGFMGWINFGQLLLGGGEWEGGVCQCLIIEKIVAGMSFIPEESDENMWRWEAKKDKGYQSCHTPIENCWAWVATFQFRPLSYILHQFIIIISSLSRNLL